MKFLCSAACHIQAGHAAACSMQSHVPLSCDPAEHMLLGQAAMTLPPCMRQWIFALICRFVGICLVQGETKMHGRLYMPCCKADVCHNSNGE
jgi:hypothetical protein